MGWNFCPERLCVLENVAGAAISIKVWNKWVKLQFWVTYPFNFMFYFMCTQYIERGRKEETVPQPLAVCVCVCLCVILGPGSCRASSLGRVWTRRLFSLHSAPCSHSCMRQNQCDLPVVHLTKDVRNVVSLLFFFINYVGGVCQGSNFVLIYPVGAWVWAVLVWSVAMMWNVSMLWFLFH